MEKEVAQQFFFDNFSFSNRCSRVHTGSLYVTDSYSTRKTREEIIDTVIDNAVYKAVFVKQLKGSDFFHWGQGQISISNNKSVFVGKLSPGPDCKLYLAKKFVNDEISFLKEKNNSLLLSDVKSFNGFAVSLPRNVNLDMYTSIVIWCETFSEFMTSAQYRY